MTDTILIFGEDHNDRTAVGHLVRALMPAQRQCDIVPLRKPIVLSRNAVASGKRRKMSEEIAAFSRGYERQRKKVAVVVHRDCDAVEPAHIKEASELEKELMSAGVKIPVAATPAWEIEAWWMLFPDALASIRRCWARVDYGSSNVGSLTNAKQRLTRDLMPKGADGRNRCPEFREDDGPRIAQTVASDAIHLKAVRARSDSFTAFSRKIFGLFDS